MAVRQATEASFGTEVLERSHQVPVVVVYQTAWCGPCRSFAALLERLAGEAEGAWALVAVDVAANPDLAAAAGVRGHPAVRGFRDGRQVAEFTGALPEEAVRSWVATLMRSHGCAGSRG